MPRFITPPDAEFTGVPIILIKNAPWNDVEIMALVSKMSTKDYDIYLYNDEMNDIQWYEGIRARATAVFDWKHHSLQDPLKWLQDLDTKVQI